MIKLCYFCQYCKHEAGFAYSSATWEFGKFECLKGHWTIYGDEPDLVDLGKELARAETCEDFIAVKGIPL